MGGWSVGSLNKYMHKQMVELMAHKWMHACACLVGLGIDDGEESGDNSLVNDRVPDNLHAHAHVK